MNNLGCLEVITGPVTRRTANPRVFVVGEVDVVSLVVVWPDLFKEGETISVLAIRIPGTRSQRIAMVYSRQGESRKHLFGGRAYFAIGFLTAWSFLSIFLFPSAAAVAGSWGAWSSFVITFILWSYVGIALYARRLWIKRGND